MKAKGEGFLGGEILWMVRRSERASKQARTSVRTEEQST